MSKTSFVTIETTRHDRVRVDSDYDSLQWPITVSMLGDGASTVVIYLTRDMAESLREQLERCVEAHDRFLNQPATV